MNYETGWWSSPWPAKTKQSKPNGPSVATIASLPRGFDFPAESPRLSEIEDILIDEYVLYNLTPDSTLKEISDKYDQTAAELIRDWQPMRLKPAVVGAFLAKANMFGRFGYIDYQKDALEKAGDFAEEMKLERIAEVIDATLATLSSLNNVR